MNIGYSTAGSTITGNTILNISGQAAITGLVVGRVQHMMFTQIQLMI